MPLLSRPMGQTAGRTVGVATSEKAVQEPAGAATADGRSPMGWTGVAAGRMRPGIFATCANPQCRSSWLHLWRRRDGPIFEGGWCCSGECTTAQMEAALGREMDARGSVPESHRHRIPLGLAMLEQGWITQDQLRSALRAQRAARAGKLGSWLVRESSVSEEQVTRTLGLQWGCPVLSVEGHNPEGLTALLPRLFIDAFGALPLRVAAGRILYLGFEDRLDPALALAVERMTGLRVESGLVRESEFRPAHARLLEARFPPVELVEAATEQALAAALAKAVERVCPVEARLVRVHDCLWLRMWLRPQNGPVPDAAFVRDLVGSAVRH